jgi:AcrR family transcriptional regulator
MTTDPAAGPQRAPRTDARRNFERLVTAARSAFAEHGADASLINIARSAGVGSATLYRHFPTREALLEAVYRSQIESLADQATQLRASQPPMEALVAWLRAFIAHMSAYRGLKGLMVTICRDEHSELTSWCRETLISAAQSVLTDAQKCGATRPDVNAYQVLRLINAIIVAGEQTGADDVQVEKLLEVVIDGLRSQSPAVTRTSDSRQRQATVTDM